MKSLLAVLSVLLVSLLHSSQSASYGGCYFEPEGRTLATGESFTPKGYCVAATCLADGTVAQRPCGLIGAPCSNPRVELEDYTKPFPDCCAKVHCD